MSGRQKVGDRDALVDELWSAIEKLPAPHPRRTPVEADR